MPNSRNKPKRPGRVQLVRAFTKMGVASRTQARQMILEGRVTVNGQVIAHIMEYVDLYHDDIRLDGRKIALIQEKTCLLLHKPTGYVTTRSDPDGRPTVYDLLPEGDHWLFPVGRLDMDSEGLLLLTDDGALADFLTDPTSNVPKRYKVLIHRSMLENDRRILEKGIRIRNFITKPCRIKHIGPDERGYWMSITISEGKNRQVRQMMHAFGYHVHCLLRTHIGPLALADLKPGEWRPLTAKEKTQLSDLRKQAEMVGNDRKTDLKAGVDWNSTPAA